MQAQLLALGITPIRIAAVNGRDPAEMARSAMATYAPLTPGEIGCFESHRRVWQKMVAEGIPAAFVLEDDMLVSDDFAHLDIAADLLAGIDLIKIDYDTTLPTCYGGKRVPVTKTRSMSRLLCTEKSTGCYLVTLRGANRLLKGTRNYMLPVDTLMFNVHSKIFWSLGVWKLRDAAAIQMTMFEDHNKLHDEFRDRIQGIARPEQEAGIAAGMRRLRVRLRRLMDRDTASQREARARKGIKDFADHHPIDQTPVPFGSSDLSHYHAARVFLDVSSV